MERVVEQVALPWGPVEYLSWGSVDGPTVVLLHGAGFDSASLSWGLLGPTLAEAGWRVVAPNHPGYGGSASPTWAYSQARLVEYVGQFVDALGARPYVLGGLSLGGGLALGHALRHPDGLRALMAFDPYGIMRWAYPAPFARAKHRLAGGLVKTRLLDVLTAAMLRWPKSMHASIDELMVNPDARTPELHDEVLAGARPAIWRLFGDFQRSEFGWNGLRTDYTPRLGEISVPALFVQGVDDPAVSLAAAREAARRLPGARLVEVQRAGHWVQRDQPAVVAEAVLDFLREVAW